MYNFNIPTPQNDAQAMAQAIRHERAKQIIREGYTFWPDADLNCIAVCKPGRLHADYTISFDEYNLTGKAGCDCPDMQKGNTCKHYLAAYILHQEQLEEEARDGATVAAYELDMAACENERTGVDYLRY